MAKIALLTRQAAFLSHAVIRIDLLEAGASED